ncbi:MAG: OmpA family protein [Salaquimonas sp.]
MNIKILLASTALALVMNGSNAFAPTSLMNLKAFAQTTNSGEATEGVADEAAKKAKELADQEAAKAAEAAQAAEAEAAKAAEAQAAAQAEADKAAQAAADAEAAKAAQEEADKAAQDQAAAEAEAAKAAQAAVDKAAADQEAADAAAKAATEAETKKASETAPVEQPKAEETQAEQAPATTTETDSAETKPAKKRKKDKVEDAAVGDAPKTDAEAVAVTPEAPPTPSAEAPVAKEVAPVSEAEQVQEAEETATAVVPDDATKELKAKLAASEKKRRKEAKNNRRNLIGAAAVGVAVGALLPAIGGRVVEDQGDRFVVERDGEYYVRKDESSLFRNNAEDVTYENLRGGRTLETIYRQNGSRIETVRDAGGYVLRRSRITRDGREVVLYDFRDMDDRRRVNYNDTLPPIQLNIPRDEYIVSGGRVGRRSLAEIFAAPPVEQIQDVYSLRDIRENSRVRDIVRRVDLDTINFDSGSFTVRNSQVPYLADVAGAMLDEIEGNTGAIFLVEGHTDAVGSDVYNLTLSDRRAETVARILVESYGVPAENLVTQGYGEQYLKVKTEADERENRRVTIRNISPLLSAKK